MNRTIKFRGKRLANGEWCYGSLLIWADGECTILEKSNSSNAMWKREIDPDTAGQFTGLHDANGKEIYEGDILQSSGWAGDYEVVYDRAVFYGATQHGIVPAWRIANERCSIIGNIHDNPELLKGGHP